MTVSDCEFDSGDPPLLAHLRKHHIVRVVAGIFERYAKPLIGQSLALAHKRPLKIIGAAFGCLHSIGVEVIGPLGYRAIIAAIIRGVVVDVFDLGMDRINKQPAIGSVPAFCPPDRARDISLDHPTSATLNCALIF